MAARQAPRRGRPRPLPLRAHVRTGAPGGVPARVVGAPSLAVLGPAGAPDARAPPAPRPAAAEAAAEAPQPQAVPLPPQRASSPAAGPSAGTHRSHAAHAAREAVMLAAERGAPCCWQPCAAVPSGAWLRWSACSGLRGRRRCVKLSDFGARRCRWNSASRRSREPLGAQRGVRSARWGARAPRPGPAERGRARGAAARAGEPPGSARAGRVLACTCWEGCRCVCFPDLCMQNLQPDVCYYGRH